MKTLKPIFLTLLLLLPLQAISNTTSMSPLPNHYQLIMLALDSGGLVVAKGNTMTGQAWYRQGNKWRPTLEAMPIPQSNYKFTGVAFKLKGWSMTRMDQTNGRTWLLIGNKWQEIQH